MSAKDLGPIKSLLNLIIDIVKDGIQIKDSGKPILESLPLLTNLIPDIGPGLSSISQIPDSLAGFSVEDASELVAYVLGKGIVSDQHAQDIINASLKLGQSAWALISVVKDAK